MFSPYYAWARRRGSADPLNFCALNVVLYGPCGRWAMTERGRGALARDAQHIAIGPSDLTWNGTRLTVRIDERGFPLPRRVRGTVTVSPYALTGATFALDAAEKHRWSPMAPRARVEVDLTAPELRWQADGYFDGNMGDQPLEQDFRRWDWSRAALPRGATGLLYDLSRGDGSRELIAQRVAADGGLSALPEMALVDLPRTRWRVARQTRADAGAAPRVLRTLVDAPFYARSEVVSRIGGAEVTAMHESLSLDRFRTPWVQAMLPFRIPRTFGM